MFGINDFDETCPGPWEWDVKRLAASFAIAGRDNGFSTKERAKVLARPCSARTAPAMQRVRGHDQPRRVVRPHRRRDGIKRAARPTSTQAQHASGPRPTWPRPAPATACRRFDKLTHVVDGAAPDHQRPAPDRSRSRSSSTGSSATRSCDVLRALIRELPPDLAERPPPPARGLPAGPRGPQGRRRRQRRHPGVDPADARPRRQGSAVPAGQGGRRRRCWRSSSGPASTASHGERVVARPAPDAGQQRHLPGLGARRGRRRRRARLLRPPAPRLEGLGRSSRP